MYLFVDSTLYWFLLLNLFASSKGPSFIFLTGNRNSDYVRFFPELQ